MNPKRCIAMMTLISQCTKGAIVLESLCQIWSQAVIVPPSVEIRVR